jgi:hypothetical protein
VNLEAGRHTYSSFTDLLEDYHDRGWTDGLPVVPPTPEAVTEFIGAAGLAGGHVVGTVPSWNVTIDVERVAINAVMAGCRPEYMPVVVAGVGALTQPEQNVHSATATLASNWQAVIVNGPVRPALGIRCDQGCMGPGFRANATIGRAVRLVVRNVMGAVPGALDRSCFSSPGRYSFCFGENEEESPWVPLAVERGVPVGQSAVSVFTTYPPVFCQGAGESPEAIVDDWIGRLLYDHSLWEPRSGSPKDFVVVIGKDHMRVFVDSGWSKQDIRELLWRRLSVLPGRGSAEGRPEPILLGGMEGIHLVAAGGFGFGSQLLTPHVGRLSTCAVEPSAAAGISMRGTRPGGLP